MDDRDNDAVPRPDMHLKPLDNAALLKPLQKASDVPVPPAKTDAVPAAPDDDDEGGLFAPSPKPKQTQPAAPDGDDDMDDIPSAPPEPSEEPKQAAPEPAPPRRANAQTGGLLPADGRADAHDGADEVYLRQRPERRTGGRAAAPDSCAPGADARTWATCAKRLISMQQQIRERGYPRSDRDRGSQRVGQRHDAFGKLDRGS